MPDTYLGLDSLSWTIILGALCIILAIIFWYYPKNKSKRSNEKKIKYSTKQRDHQKNSIDGQIDINPQSHISMGNDKSITINYVIINISNSSPKINMDNIKK